MFMSKSRRSALIGVMLSAVALSTVQPAAAGAATGEESPRPVASRQSPVRGVEEDVARSLASALPNPQWRERVRKAALGSEEVNLHALTAKASDAAETRLRAEIANADQRILDLKGLPAETGPLLRLRLAAPSMRRHLSTAGTPWVAVAAADDHAQTITAYDSRGRRHAVDTRRVPEQPLYIVDIDVSRAHQAGLEILDNALARKGMGGRAQARADAAAGWWATKITAIEVNDDQEPWFKGAAEMFSLVTGFGLDGKPRVDSVDMPYLDYDHTVYRPNQILVNWSNYKYNLADVVMMEDDDGTNYKSLAQALTTALLTVTDQGTYIPLVNALLAAMPDSWFTDDPDYVESWYTLAKDSSGRLDGASGNGWMTVEPYFVEEF
jgi:hypothetical protein